MPRKAVTESGGKATPRKTKTGKTTSRTTLRATSVDQAEKDAQAVRLRRDGLGYQAIADRLDYANASGAWKAVQRTLKLIQHDAVDELRTLELERLDVMLASLAPLVTAGPELTDIELPTGETVRALVPRAKQLDAMDRVMRIMEQRRRLVPDLEVPKAVQPISDPTGGAPFQVVLGFPSPDPSQEPIPEEELGKS